MTVDCCGVITDTDGLTRFIPRTRRPAGRLGVALFHGAGNPTEFEDPVNQLASVQLAVRIASEGIPCVAGPFGGDTWADDAILPWRDTALAALAALGCSATSMVGGGVSMGHSNLLRCAIDTPSKFAAGFGVIPLCDLVGFYSGNVHGYQAAIAAAWGVTAPASLPARADVLTNASAIAGKPWWLNYSTADTYISPSSVTALAAVIGSSCAVTQLTPPLEHSDASVGEFVTAQIPPNGRSGLIGFLLANGC